MFLLNMIKSGTSSTRSVDLGKLLVHPQSNDPGNQYLTSGGATNIITSNAGGHIPSGTVNIEPVNTQLYRLISHKIQVIVI